MYGYEQTASTGHGHPHGGQQHVHQGPHPGHGHQQTHQGYHQGHQGHQQYAAHQEAPPPYGQQPLYPEPSPPSLTEAVRAFTTGSMGPEDFQAIFSTSKVYCPRGDTPGFLALHNTQQPVIPMFTTLKELRRYAGKESKYFVITGAEVLDLLPSGYGFVLDMEGDHRVVFDAKAVEEMVDFAMRSMYG
ncbi:SseB family protein [Streptomyces sp. JJ36]|uniref:SseB family protein n=1 Tax=Streptomyces sp. JJ36 TaxID=2736645 RepID=UPI001F46F6BA|nr:SseB family protein [Streptomyces sp. JJ36]MCF6524088.1 SseB family protein [Streptomyces sp. JJ36]